jgi:hypothetical protein
MKQTQTIVLAGDENKGNCPHHAVTNVTNYFGWKSAIITTSLYLSYNFHLGEHGRDAETKGLLTD